MSVTKFAVFLSPIGSIIPAINRRENIKSTRLITGEITLKRMRSNPAVPTAFLMSIPDAIMIESPSLTYPPTIGT